MAKKKLLLIGAGPTSSLIVSCLGKSRLKDVFDIHVWEKDRCVGGRFSSFRSPKHENGCADLGAQYLTRSGDNKSEPYFSSLLENELIHPFDTHHITGFRNDPSKVNYFCKFGTSSVVKHFFDQGAQNNLRILPERAVRGVRSTSLREFSVISEQGVEENFDFVVSTIPVPSLLNLQGLSDLLRDRKELHDNLRNVNYTSRFALGLYYNDREGPFSSTFDSIPAMNFADHPVIRYWSVENKKRGHFQQDPYCSIVVHTTVAFGAEMIHTTVEKMEDFLLGKTKEVIPFAEDTKPEFVFCQKWDYSQVHRAYPNSPGCVEIANNFVAAGDGFTRSGFEGCIESAEATVSYLCSHAS